VTSLFAIKGRFLGFTQKRQDGFTPKIFSGLGENTCSLQLALKSNALGL